MPLHDTIAALSNKPEHDLVGLSTYQDFLSFRPYWNFQTSYIEYANPLADFNGRREAIESRAKSPSAEAMLAQTNHLHPGRRTSSCSPGIPTGYIWS